ncbi:DEAD/DEAH box helicase [Azospirillum sp. ST 5-10]|uniref:DEAD/DEAH box helicase n=1 Tax=unclassified Azospirillum TaxID=2630922 RepID=UPI003F4A2CED
MTLHPIAVVNHVIAEYRNHVSTEFRARDERLRAALQSELDRPLFLAQYPFFQAHRPFKEGRPWRDLGLDARLARVMEERSQSPHAYLHQSEAIEHLLGPSAGPLAVTTGTGSGKTECFLLPVIQNAIEDSSRFQGRPGITAILVYPMNALANDQEERINDYLARSGHTHVKVRRYDRSTKQDEREAMRRNPPHILLTNYMMLEYLLVRAADREDLFADHRCHFVVLDEVHTYRGSLGANIALLLRRLHEHLRRARQEWRTGDRTDSRRFPEPVTVATSATIKSVDEAGRRPDEVRRLRDEAVQQFLSSLTGLPPDGIRVLGEELQDLHLPNGTRWPAEPAAITMQDPHDPAQLRLALAAHAGGDDPAVDLAGLAARAGILWMLGDMLARKPMSVEEIAERIIADVPERHGAQPDAVRREVESALAVGAALPDEVHGALRLRTHRFIRGGWRFHRCVDPACGRLHPMGEEECASCGSPAAPLLVCRNCGADTLRFRPRLADTTDPQAGLAPYNERTRWQEWILYDLARYDDLLDDNDALVAGTRQMRGETVRSGSFEPTTCSYSDDPATYPMRVALAPARNTCLVCGGSAGPRDVVTPVSLGTSAAVRVLSESLVEKLAQENAGRPGHDGKERLLVFADSRQDAAHQARFITYAGRYDRMRRRLVDLLAERPLSINEAVRGLMVEGVRHRDNPHMGNRDDADLLPRPVQERARAWEEAPLLDDLALGAGYRATIFNLGLVGVRYDKLDRHVARNGRPIAVALGIDDRQLLHVCQAVLDEMRRRGALSRPMLRYHPASPTCPDDFREPADWERRIKAPNGYACDEQGNPVANIDLAELPAGIRGNNFWRRERTGGRGPSLERRLKHLVARLAGVQRRPGDDESGVQQHHLLELIEFLKDGPGFITAVPLYGFRAVRTLLQVNEEAILLERLDPTNRFRCNVCNVRMPFAETGLPCPACRGTLERIPDEELGENRYVRRIRNHSFRPLIAGEHTAQVTSDGRIDLEQKFKSGPNVSPVNVLACSPTLEMGIDVGGLDAVVLRNVPPRPDNYAQRGGRAGRRTRVGVVVGYARSTPHDAYFFDKPREMIAGEVPSPGIGLANRDVLRRHLNAILFGLADPPLAGRMFRYLDNMGELRREAVDELLAALEARRHQAATIAWEGFGPLVLEEAGYRSVEDIVAEYRTLPERIGELLQRTSLQIKRLREATSRWYENLNQDRRAMHAARLINRILGIPDDDRRAGEEADDRSAGNPMRRFAEFGILPGYEFPNAPCTLRLLRDDDEAEPIAVERRFGISQYQPEAPVHARGHRWRVDGLDLSSPWNPKGTEPSWIYFRCGDCGLRYDAQEPLCPRCRSGNRSCPADGVRGYEFGGFIAKRDDSPVLEEEDRFASAALVTCHPQRNGRVVARYGVGSGWRLEVRRGEDVHWVNEGRGPTDRDRELAVPLLLDDARGYHVCPSCGRILTIPEGEARPARGRRRPAQAEGRDLYGHAQGCERANQRPQPLALVARSAATTLRLLVDLPDEVNDADYKQWGHSLAAALRAGLRHLYMLDGAEIDAELEHHWTERTDGGARRLGAITFIDAAVGGTGFLERAAREMHLVAARALDHLDHPNCQSACYRCLKSYQNQRFHEHLHWPRIEADVAALAAAAPTPVPLAAADTDDPRPWLDAYAEGVGSPLELRFLALFRKHGLAVDKQVRLSADPGGPCITVADFVITGTRVAIYVDGASFHTGENLRRDRFIRDRLRNGSIRYIVEELTARDLQRGGTLVEALRRLGEEHPAA